MSAAVALMKLISTVIIFIIVILAARSSPSCLKRLAIAGIPRLRLVPVVTTAASPGAMVLIGIVPTLALLVILIAMMIMVM